MPLGHRPTPFGRRFASLGRPLTGSTFRPAPLLWRHERLAMMSKAARRVIFGLLYGGTFLAPTILFFLPWTGVGRRLFHLRVSGLYFFNAAGLSAASMVLLLGWVGVFLRSEVCLSRVAVFTLVVCGLLPILREFVFGW